MTFLYIGLGLTALVVICVLIIVIMANRIKSYRNENKNLKQANNEAAVQLEHIRGYMAKNKIVMEEADEKRQELEKTSDSDLARRANNLFGGVRDPATGTNGQA